MKMKGMGKLNKKTKTKAIVVVLGVALLGLFLILQLRQRMFQADIVLPPGESQVENLSTNWQDYEAQGSSEQEPKVLKYDKFELTFDIEWYHNRQFGDPSQKYDPIADSTINPFWPYDENPTANGVPAGKGISVDGIFTDPDGMEIVQPGFYFQNYEYTQKLQISGGPDEWRPWLYPAGSPVWKIRFTPDTQGSWQYKIRIRDISGETDYNTESIFAVVPSPNRGFVKVSDDPRYFETSDGTYLNLVGMADHDNGGAGGAGRYFIDPGVVDEVYPTLKQNGINLVRSWWQGSQGPVLFGLSNSAGNIAGWDGVNITSHPITGETDKVMPGELFSFNLEWNPDWKDKDTGEPIPTNSYFVAQTAIPVKPSTTYKYSAMIKTDGLTGTGDYGFDLGGCCLGETIASANWPSRVVGDTDWHEVSAEITTTAGGNFLHWLRFDVWNRTGGNVYVSRVSLKEDLGGGNYGPEILMKPNPNVYKYVSPDQAWLADYQVKKAKENDIYLKIVAEEKQDVAFGNIDTDGLAGNIAANQGELADWLYAYTSDNPDAKPPIYNNDSAGRVYQMYYWRYLIARYGYSPNIHSFELVNEGQVGGNWMHEKATGAMANYFNNYDPNKHLVTTSFWHSLASWFIQNYQDVGYGDWHKYNGDCVFGAMTECVPDDGTDAYVPGWWSWKDFSYYYSGGSTILPKPRDPPSMLQIFNSLDNTNDLVVRSNPIPVVPNHTYTLRWKMQGNLSYRGAGRTTSAFMGTNIAATNWGAYDVSTMQNKCYTDSSFTGVFPWKEASCQFTTPDSGWYLTLFAVSPKTISGPVWFDDITLFDETAQKSLEVLNGNFEENRLDFDSALMVYNFGYQVGEKDNRQIKKPIIIGETGIAGSAANDLPNDTEGIWYKKFIWGHINLFGVTAMYWILDAKDDFLTKGFGRYARVYQDFMADIGLSGGKYENAAATVSDSNLRAWGQKEVDPETKKADKAHLWIDNKPYTWKNVVDGNVPSPISGTVTISDLKNGIYHLKWYNTGSGAIEKEENLTATDSNLEIPVTDLVSDIALKIEIKEVAPVDSDSSRTLTYKTRYHVFGTKSSDIVKVLVNGEEAFVNAGDDTWSIDLDLTIGQNTITAVGEDSFGNKSEPAVYTLTRRKPADANGDNSLTNISDFSVLLSNWNKTNINNPADLNENEIVNISDFSILLANWGK